MIQNSLLHNLMPLYDVVLFSLSVKMNTKENQTNVIEGFKLQISASVCCAWQ